MSVLALRQARAALLRPLGTAVLAGLAVSIGQIFGIPVTVSPFITIMIVIFTLGARRYVLREVGWYPNEVYWVAGVVGGIAMVLTIIGHEVSHAIVSQYLGVSITRMHFTWWGAYVHPAKPLFEVAPSVEFLVCLAGPLFNLAVAGMLVIPVLIFGESAAENTVQYVCSTNASLAAVNLIPLHPFDGGKILHAILWGILGNSETANVIVGVLSLLALIIVGSALLWRIVEKVVERRW